MSCKYIDELKSSPINTMADWQDKRFLWFLMAFVAFALLFTAHNVFQHYVYMPPCEQCVYIRYSFFCILFGGLIAAINPKQILLKIVGYILGFYGIITGMLFSIKLNGIHAAAHGDDPFGVQGCSTDPTFPFGLPLANWWPDWFSPTGDCGYDNPIVPDGTELSGLQQWLVDLYSDGWYLIPSAHFGNMAQCTFLAFLVCFLALLAMFASWIIRDFLKKQRG